MARLFVFIILLFYNTNEITFVPDINNDIIK
jgi:hypothetical protein